MKYRGRYKAFDARAIRTYPVSQRPNKVTHRDILQPDDALRAPSALGEEVRETIASVAREVVRARRAGCAVLCFAGAHLIKNGMGVLLADLAERGFLTLVAGNGATAIHDFELALIGATSENVPNALPRGRFGMAAEFALFNACAEAGLRHGLGLGEALGRAMWDEAFRTEAWSLCGDEPLRRQATAFGFRGHSVLARAYAAKVPFTVHVSIGTDVCDQHPGFDGAAKGGTSANDFAIFVHAAGRLAGGVALNVGSAVTGPEVLLKAVSMAANAGLPADGLVTADFDIRPCQRGAFENATRFGYYFRDQKSVVERIPRAFGGLGFYVEGDQKETFAAFYRALRSSEGERI